jgi:autotransporter-associated beta strand protein
MLPKQQTRLKQIIWAWERHGDAAIKNKARPLNLGKCGQFGGQDGAALGGTVAGTVIAFGAELDLGAQVNVGAEPLSLADSGVDGQGAFKGSGTNSWAGPITLAGAATLDIAANSLTLLTGVISGGGADTLTKNGAGTLEFNGSAANTYTGTTIVERGALIFSRTNATAVPGPLVIGNDVDGPDSETVFLFQDGQLAATSPLTIDHSGLLNVGNGNFVTAQVGALTGTGAIQIPAGSLGVESDNSSSVFAGSISGSGAFDKYGSGTLTLTGNGSLSGPVYVVGGQLLINGSLASAAINVYPSTVLGGIGTVGPIIGSGVVNPGAGGPGILNSGKLSFASGSSFTPILNGASPGNYSQLNVAGTVNLTGAGLQLSQGVLGAVNSHCTIINNDGADAVTGTFAGLPEGATVVANNGVHFAISYHGGTGNDVVLTQTGLFTPPDFTALIKSGSGPSTLNGTGLSNVTYHLQANTNLAVANWITLGPVTANGLGVWSFIDSSSTNCPIRFYRLVYP